MSTIDNILEIAKQNGMNDQDVCKILGLSNSGVYHWKNGKGEPSATQLLTLAQRFGVSVDYLLTRKKNSQDFMTDNNSPNSEIKKEPPSVERLARDIETILLEKGIIEKDIPMDQAEKKALLDYLEITAEAFKKLRKK